MSMSMPMPMSMSNLIIENFTTFEVSKHVDKNLITIPIEDNAYFGILNVKTASCQMTDKTQEFVFVIDRSGSMCDICNDGRTKMHHIKHTLQNMVTYCCQLENIQIYVSIFMFDDNLDIVIERTLVDKNNMNEILQKIQEIQAGGCTNIEEALTEVAKYMNQLNLSHNINHIFMTDGQATAGETNREKLKKMVIKSNVSNSFIGFGIDHDSVLLSHVSNDKNSSYYFIDAIERSGLVYGEILHGILYKLLTDVYITIDNGLIYDYKNNVWTNKLCVEDITGDANKTYHLVSKEALDCRAFISANELDYCVGSNIIVNYDTDLTKYIYRQRTLCMLYDVKSFQENFISHDDIDMEKTLRQKSRVYKQCCTYLKNSLKELYEEIKKYMTDNALTDDKFMKNLCDDIFVCHKTFGTKYGAMYSTSRQTSQATQRCYAVNQTPITNPYGRRRFDVDIMDEDNELVDHELSNFIDTPYSSQTATMVMSAVSGFDFVDDDLNKTQIM